MLSINVWFQVCVDIGLPEMPLQMRLGGLKEEKLFGSSLLKPRCLSYPRQKKSQEEWIVASSRWRRGIVKFLEIKKPTHGK